ncbi:MAG: hypothetical protein L6Q84_08645 [Polyangiaceae bacterium]|nr:hypothetical protein [Polyangiaceae bacterium]
MSKLGRDIVTNVVFAAVNAAGIWLLMRLSTGWLSPVALALFLLVRRYSASLVGVLALGAPTFQLRYVGMYANDDKLRQLIDLVVMLGYAVTSVLVLAALALGGDTIAGAVFPAKDYPSWVPWYVALLSVQQLYHFVVINNLLLSRRMVLYNVYKLLCASGLYIAALALEQKSVQRVFVWYLAGSMVLLGIGHWHFTLPALRGLRRLPFERTKWLVREALLYGPPRSAINVMDSLLFVITPWLIRGDVEDVGYLLTMFVLVQATGLIVLPVNELAMVVGAKQLGASEVDKVRASARTLLEVMVGSSAILVASIYPFKAVLLRVFIASDTVLAGVDRFGLLLSCIVPLTVYNGLKGIIEVRWRFPKNLVNLVVSSALGIGAFYTVRSSHDSIASVTTACMVTFWSLGALTVVSAWELLRGASWKSLFGAVGPSSAVLVAALVAAPRLGLAGWPTLLQLVIVGVLAFALVVTWWYIAKPEVLRHAHRLLQPRRSE